ncbi:MAG: hypothetical protein IJ258_04860 [Methanobrevibacter sp.]|uniref:hypothetical protein n=1 Tax=Methanobrevibacter sp. TaxID=66852 RepID=UPI0025E9D53E|nr:hypothetical protein [Methanobrevibacter sp.]MBQ8017421.1 hypothetical protein [Methanobrevibacter sp.]
MNGKLIFFLLIFVSICAISHISTEEIADNSTGDLIASDGTDEVIIESPQVLKCDRF